ncbi:hypothetical protein ACQBAU_16110 [Propionibacteriaceae bacterium Y2011]
MKTPTSYHASLADAIEARATGPFDYSLCLYISDGGTLIIASTPEMTDSRRPRDLLAVLPIDLGAGRVIPLWPAVNPDLVNGLEQELAQRAAAVTA